MVILVHQNKGEYYGESRPKKAFYFNKMRAHQSIEMSYYSIFLVQDSLTIST